MNQKKIFSVSATLPTTDVPQLTCGVSTPRHLADGLEPVTIKAVLDTGSNRCAVSPRLATMLELEYKGESIIDAATEKEAKVELYYGAVFVFGNFQVGPRYVHVVDLVDEEDESKSIDALIGMGIIGLGRLNIEPAGDNRYRYEFRLEAEL